METDCQYGCSKNQQPAVGQYTYSHDNQLALLEHLVTLHFYTYTHFVREDFAIKHGDCVLSPIYVLIFGLEDAIHTLF